jgi:prefoldin subunit 5
MDQGQQSPTPAELQQQVDALRQQVAALRTELDVERQNRAFVVTVENEVVSGAGSYLQTTIRELVGDLLVALKRGDHAGEDLAIWRRKRLLAVIRQGVGATPEVTIF